MDPLINLLKETAELKSMQTSPMTHCACNLSYHGLHIGLADHNLVVSWFVDSFSVIHECGARLP